MKPELRSSTFYATKGSGARVALKWISECNGSALLRSILRENVKAFRVEEIDGGIDGKFRFVFLMDSEISEAQMKRQIPKFQDQLIEGYASQMDMKLSEITAEVAK